MLCVAVYRAACPECPFLNVFGGFHKRTKIRFIIPLTAHLLWSLVA